MEEVDFEIEKWFFTVSYAVADILKESFRGASPHGDKDIVTRRLEDADELLIQA